MKDCCRESADDCSWLLVNWWAVLETIVCMYAGHLQDSRGCWNSLKKGNQNLLAYNIHVTDIDGLVQDCSNSSALAMELLQLCTKPSICCFRAVFIGASKNLGCGSQTFECRWFTCNLKTWSNSWELDPSIEWRVVYLSVNARYDVHGLHLASARAWISCNYKDAVLSIYWYP